MPLKLVLGTAVYSLGFFGGLKAMFKSFSRGEITDLTSLVYDAREHAIGLISGRRRRSAPTTSWASSAYPRVGRPDRVHGDRHRRETRAWHRHGHAHPAAAGIIKDKDTSISRDNNLFAAVGASKRDQSS